MITVRIIGIRYFYVYYLFDCYITTSNCEINIIVIAIAIINC